MRKLFCKCAGLFAVDVGDKLLYGARHRTESSMPRKPKSLKPIRSARITRSGGTPTTFFNDHGEMRCASELLDQKIEADNKQSFGRAARAERERHRRHRRQYLPEDRYELEHRRYDGQEERIGHPEYREAEIQKHADNDCKDELPCIHLPIFSGCASEMQYIRLLADRRHDARKSSMPVSCTEK